MEALVIILSAVVAIGAVGWLIGRGVDGANQYQVKQLAASLCPHCSAPIGRDEAEAAYDRAHQFASDHTMAREEMGDYSSAPVVCPSCQQPLIWWVATRTLHRKSEGNES